MTDEERSIYTAKVKAALDEADHWRKASELMDVKAKQLESEIAAYDADTGHRHVQHAREDEHWQTRHKRAREQRVFELARSALYVMQEQGEIDGSSALEASWCLAVSRAQSMVDHFDHAMEEDE